MDDITLGVVVGLGLLLLYVQGEPASAPPIAVSIGGGGVLPPQPPAPQPPNDPPPSGQPPVVVPGSGRGTGPNDCIIAMSADPAQIRADVRRTMAYYGRDDDDYWVGLVDHPGGPFSNGLWYWGWNKYWFLRADPNNQGSADPFTAGEPAPV